MKPSGNYYPPGTDLTYKNISHDEERRLFAAARAGDDAAREFLIKNHLLFATLEGRRWAYGKLPEDEVVSTANLALMRAFDRFDYTRPERFTSYLRPFIRGHMANLWRSKNTMGEHAPTFPEKDGFVPVPFPKCPETEDHPFEQDDHRRFILKLLGESKDILSEIEREVISRHFGEKEEFLCDIAKDHGLTRSRIQQIKDSALKKLRRELPRRMKRAGVKL